MTDPAIPDAWCEVHRDRIEANIRIALARVPKGRRFCAVLKADAYGHGIATVVPLVRAHGIDCIAITSNAEARAVRDAGYTGQLIRLRAATPVETRAALPDRVEEQVGTVEAAENLATLKASGAPVRAHLSLNAMGMSRDGLEIGTDEGRAACRAILDRLGDSITAICTHFPDNAPDELRASAALFQQHADWVLDQGNLSREGTLVHAGSSLTLVSDQPVQTDMYRCGAVLYGILKPDWGFQTTMTLKTRVVSVADYPAGATVGYDRTCVLDTPRRLACLSIGYANGVRRAGQNTGTVLIGGHEAPILGRISMNTTVADVTGLDGISVGDPAAIFGGSHDTRGALDTAEAQFGTIIADLYTDWGLSNHRIVR